MSAARLLRLAVLVLALHAAAPAPALTHPAGLQASWQAYLAEAAQREPAFRFPHESCFRQAAAEHDLPLTLLLAVARGESDFDPLARSKANARGLMQILWPDTARELGIQRLADLHDPCTNVDAGARYLKQMLQRYGGDLHRALAAYNYGPGRIPPGDSALPAGASWYSGYIYRHLRYVLGGEAPPAPPAQRPDYGAEAKQVLIVFRRPYRAQAFVDTLQAAAPGLRLDWFRVRRDRFRVVLIHRGEAELERARASLRRAGFSPGEDSGHD